MFTITAKNKIMASIFCVDVNLLPKGLLVGLSLSEPTQLGGNITEPTSDTGYARVPLEPNMLQVSEGVVTNCVSIEFPVFAEYVGVVTHYILYDHEGAPFWYGTLKQPQEIKADRIFVFPIGNLQIKLVDDGGVTG